MKFGSNICHDKGAVIGLVVMVILGPLLIYSSIVWSFDQECGKDCYDKDDDHGFSSSNNDSICDDENGFACWNRETGEKDTDLLCGCDTIDGIAENDSRVSDQVGPQFCCEDEGKIEGFWSALVRPVTYFNHLRGWKSSGGISTGEEPHVGRLYYYQKSFYVPLITAMMCIITMIILGTRASNGIVC